ncbi:DUF3857 domain-containing protein [Pontibacter qinzhouensis]|uniref:DUF3857 domain-containing protein n=1 Tax=Pontibacter qinzhouensis TaxID=2603253 RepID=A0A5C8K7U7_9BACT|nr:DUF3857 domain-containing transglutaminase family protein [Pontibacter qinzhouensis]TXK49017.1 DUF3857 domain-containing protein [Pontibacter qinzhouensis]
MPKFYYTFCLVAWLCGMAAEANAEAGKTIAPADLEKGANVVVLSEEIYFTVNAAGSGINRTKATIKVLNRDGQNYAKLYVNYDKLTKVDFIKGTTFNAAGKKVKSLSKSDIKDISAMSDISLFDDDRAKVADLTHGVFPYTVEYEYQTTSNNMMFYPFWMPQRRTKVGVEAAMLQVSMPKGMTLRYRETNLQKGVEKSATATHEVFTWRMTQLAPLADPEPYGPSFAEYLPSVRTAPSDFEVQGYTGNMDSWESFGHWINKLNTGRDVLPEATQKQVQALVANCKTPEEKVQKVYEFLQSKTRYINVSLGIGGWQPFEASYVDAKGYGDCKGLSNYTKALLKTAGIESYYTLINAGDNAPKMILDFPSSQFNHAVLCVPMPKDTIWLECTSQTNSVGYAGSFTGDRHALLITPEGGKVVKTPKYGANDNVQKRRIEVKLDEHGNGTAKVTTLYSGIQQESRENVINSYKPDEQRKWLYQQVSVPAFEINNFALDLKKSKVPEVTEKIDLSLTKCVTISGKRLFLTPNLMTKWDYVPNPVENRKTDVLRQMSFLDIDTVMYQLPVGYALESQPKDVEIESVFGVYKAKTTVEGTQVFYIRSLQMEKGRYPADKYPALIEFMNTVLKADKQQVVFVKNVP